MAKFGSTTFNVAPQGERGALTVVNGWLYVGYGGLYGDCGNYHGWVVGVSLADPTTVQSWATTAQAGGVWSMGGVSSDGTNLFIATGNTMAANGVWGGGDAIIRFASGAAFPGTPDYFTPMNWVTLDNGDLDLGAAPIPFTLAGSTPAQLVIAFGKDGHAYLANPNNLGGVSDALAQPQVATNQIICAPALYTTPTATYVSYKGNGSLCTGGTSGALSTLKIVPGSPPTLAGSWCAAGGNGSPMVTTTDGTNDAIVWSPGAETDDLLHGFDGDTGAVIFNGGGVKVPNMRRYNTPIAAKGRIFVAADNTVVAFKP